MTPTWEVETDNKEGFKDIVKAADGFASRVGSGKGVDKDKIHKGNGKGDSPKEKTSQIKSKIKGNPKGNPKIKSGTSTKSDKKEGKGPKKRCIPRQDRREEYRRGWKEKQWKTWFERTKTTATRMAAKQRKVKSGLH